MKSKKGLLGGVRLASEMVRPHVVKYLDGMLRQESDFRIKNYEIPTTSWFIGTKLKKLDIIKKQGLKSLPLNKNSKIHTIMFRMAKPILKPEIFWSWFAQQNA
ncbi:MAG: hypothetical protein ACI9BD_000175 [Candidatus Marinamargulisbacteria bacterium]|jgi:hypothetical protein